MKSLQSIRSNLSPFINDQTYALKEAYAQYLFRMNLESNLDSWFEFICAHNCKKKISIPLRIIDGGIK